MPEQNNQEPSKLSSRDSLSLGVFLFALILLSVTGFAAYRTVNGLMLSQGSVAHTLEVESSLANLRAEVINSQGLRRGYVIERKESELGAYYASLDEIAKRLVLIRQLTTDNPDQQRRLELVEPLLKRRRALQKESIDLVQSARSDQAQQASITIQTGEITRELTSLIVSMEDEERILLQQRQENSFNFYRKVLWLLLASLIAAFVLLSVQFWMISRELRRRKAAEESARASEQSARRLSLRLLHLQDEERRRFSRELHDSLGQYLSALGINLALLEDSTTDKDAVLAECHQLLSMSLTETRTLSYLLHPPLLDEAGLVSAIRWYVEGFAARSGIEVKLDLLESPQRLPQAMELVLFRVLQESLTNIHRHAKCTNAEIEFCLTPREAVLLVRDFGCGISPLLLANFHVSGSGMGVGLGGMRERLHEVGGQLEIHSDSAGTVVMAKLPLPKGFVSVERIPSDGACRDIA